MFFKIKSAKVSHSTISYYGYNMWSDPLCTIFLISTLLKFSRSQTNNSSGCQLEPTCLKCGSTGCIKCPGFIIYPSRKCVSSCPFGYSVKWSKTSDYMGQMCVPTTTFMGLSADGASILTGILCGTVLCVVIVVLGFLYVRYKRRNLSQIIETNSDVDDPPERRDFIKQLETLRPYAKTFLEMLNDTRRQMRELHQAGDNTAASAYKPVVRDLAKILLLLNRPADMLAIPADWGHLYRWSEKVLKRYKRMSETSQTQVNQLIKFLQSPVILDEPDEYSRASTTMSTFKPDQAFGSSSSLQEQKAKNVSSSCESTFNAPLNPQWQFNNPVGSNNQFNSSEFIPAQWKNSKEYLNSPYFLEDDFLQLGFRPQDEITTEL